MAGSLEGVRVIDMTRILAGPWCTQLLGDLGAEVIKVEHPLRGDDTRQWGPPWLKDEDGNETAESSYYLSANRNKSSLAVDIKTPEGCDIVKQLVQKSDVFIENFKVGGLVQYGLDYESLKKINPEIVYLSITGFGQTGPMAKQPGYDYLIQGLGGLMSITGLPDDVPGGGPQRVGVAITDITTGLYATIGILSSLYERKRTGKGQYVDLALLDTMAGWLANQASSYLTGGKLPGRTGNWHPNLAPYQPFKTKDGNMILAVGNDMQFESLCNILGLPALVSDPRFATNPDRNANRVELEKLLQAQFSQNTTDYWVTTLPSQGVPASAINSIQETFDMPQIQARNMQIEMTHPLSGKIQGVANPLKFSETEITYRKPPPMHGEDTDDILESILSIDKEKIESLRQRGILK